VYAHIYHQHFTQVVELGEEAHLNTSFKHFIFFVQEFNLIDKRELAPLQELIDRLSTKDLQKPQLQPAPGQTKEQLIQEQLEKLREQHVQQQKLQQQQQQQQAQLQQMQQQLMQQQQLQPNNNMQIVNKAAILPDYATAIANGSTTNGKTQYFSQ
jgi:uncharacterized membrane-anchored protein YjiN (DUF445 family)